MPAAYLKLGDVDGETKDARFKGWIDLESLSMPQMGTAAGATAGHAGIPATEILVVKHYDRTSPGIAQAAATGRSFDKAVIVRTGMGEGVVGSALILEDVYISSIQFSGGGSGPGRPMESLTLIFRKLTMGTMSDYSAQYGPAAPAGKAKPGAPGRTR